MPEYQSLVLEMAGSAATIWLNRPQVRNAFDGLMIAELTSAFRHLNTDEATRVVVLRGRGKAFCAGADLNWMRDVAQFTPHENYNDSLALAKCFRSIHLCSKPTVAIVHGSAFGGANGLLAACDFAFAESQAVFAFSEVKIGIAPATIAPYVLKRIGEYTARDLMLTGRRFSGEEAARIRLVNAHAPEDQLEALAFETIEHLLSSGPAAMQACKKLIFDLSNIVNHEQSLSYTANLIAELRASEEGQEGMAAFFEKRAPKWLGH